MRLAWVFVAIGAFSGCVAPSVKAPGPVSEVARSYPEAGKTYLHWDEGHGYQVNYLEEGTGWLWYPGNRVALREIWRLETVKGQSFLCFVYPKGSRNPVTGGTGGTKQCQPLEVSRRGVVAALPGDVFGLRRGVVPYPLSRKAAPPEFGRVR